MESGNKQIKQQSATEVAVNWSVFVVVNIEAISLLSLQSPKIILFIKSSTDFTVKIYTAQWIILAVI